MSVEIDSVVSVKDGNDKKNLFSDTRRKLASNSAVKPMTDGKLEYLEASSDCLKSEIQRLLTKIDQSAHVFDCKLSNNMVSVLNLLSCKQTHIQSALDICFEISSNMVETFLVIGYELEKDLSIISSKVNDLDLELRTAVTLPPTTGEIESEGTSWFVNSEGRLTERKCTAVGPILPDFVSGDINVREEFIHCLSEVFKEYQIPESLWVKLAANQLVGTAKEWWQLNIKDNGLETIEWKEFCDRFLERPVNNIKDDNHRRNVNVTNQYFTRSKNKRSNNCDDINNSLNCKEDVAAGKRKLFVIENLFQNRAASEPKNLLTSGSNYFNQVKFKNNLNKLKNELSMLCDKNCSDRIFNIAAEDKSASKSFQSNRDENNFEIEINNPQSTKRMRSND